MDVYIARQPIFDRNMGIYGYELLYRKNQNNYFLDMDDDLATAELIYNSFFVFGLKDLVDDSKAFINFSKALIDSDMPYLLPPQSIVVEILEREEVTPTTIEACRKMKSMGYMLALDDFVFDEKYIELIDMADIIKIEFPSVRLDIQRRLINKYKSKITFLAEKVETREEYKQACEMGYKLFQGYFFSKPSIINSKEIGSLNTNLFRIIEELNSIEPSYTIISNIIECDLGISYKLLKLANSAYMRTKNKIQTISQALSYIGINELYQWISIMMVKDFQNIENAELIKISLTRAKFMDLLASELNINENGSEYFFTGIFSNIDILLNKSMDQAINGLPLLNNVKQALLGENNTQRHLLNCVIDFEMANWNKVKDQDLICKIESKKFMALYIESLNWTKKLNY